MLQRFRSLLPVRYQWFCFLLLDGLARLGIPDRIFLPVCGWFWVFFGKTEEGVLDFVRFGRRLSLEMGFATWYRFRRLRGVSIGSMVRFHRWLADPARPRIKIDGGDAIADAKALGRGVLVLTYHHHLNMTFCAAVGRFFGSVSVFARSPKASPAYPTLKYFADRVYADSEAFFSGGGYLYVDPEKPLTSRGAIQAFRNNSLVVSVHDFPALGPPSMTGLFLNSAVAYPTGAIDYAVRRKIPIVFGFLEWRGADEFRLCFRRCGASDDTRAVLTNYFSVIEQEFFGQPERWEYWGSLC